MDCLETQSKDWGEDVSTAAAQRAADRIEESGCIYEKEWGGIDFDSGMAADIIDKEIAEYVSGLIPVASMTEHEIKSLGDSCAIRSVAGELKRCLSVAQALKKALQEVVDGVAEYASKYERRPWEDALKLAEENGI